jgi:tetratricopeptide (TPR) repeat protein
VSATPPINSGDSITSINGKQVDRNSERALRLDCGKQVVLGIRRRSTEFTATTAARPFDLSALESSWLKQLSQASPDILTAQRLEWLANTYMNELGNYDAAINLYSAILKSYASAPVVLRAQCLSHMIQMSVLQYRINAANRDSNALLFNSAVPDRLGLLEEDKALATSSSTRFADMQSWSKELLALVKGKTITDQDKPHLVQSLANAAGPLISLRPPEAFALADEAMNLYDSCDTKRTEFARLPSFCANAARTVGNYQRAIELDKRLFDSTKSEFDLGHVPIDSAANAYKQLVEDYILAGNLESAKQLATECMSFLGSHGAAQSTLDNASFMLARVLEDEKCFDQAEQIYRGMLSAATAANDGPRLQRITGWLEAFRKRIR